ncbi:RNA helicase Mov10l1-like [Cimex lectularius]|uniref:RNA helicase n=1 Tax=Cimex lectularius TaxID=79782 RepID=A0A8I6S5G2_CIMLE|nr:RNA helicase Mov10l1-like [Cimex lectularius]
MYKYLRGFFEKIGIVKELDTIDEDEIVQALYNDDGDEYNLTKIQNYMCQSYKGKVTHLNDRVAVIDYQYYFHLKNTQLSHLKIGDVVTCKLYTKDLDTLVRSVQKVDGESEDEYEVIDEKKQRNLEGLTELKITGKIVKKVVRKITIETRDEEYPIVEFNMDNVRAEFIPMAGDIVELECLIPDGSNPDLQHPAMTVEMVLPKKTMLKHGVVTEWDSVRGVITGFAEFTVHTCEPGYQPTVGDKVLASVIRSDQNGYSWRAVQVVPQSRQFDTKLSKQHEEARRDLLRDKEGVYISKCAKFEIKLNDVKKFTVELSNKSLTTKYLLQCSSLAKADLSQLVLIKPENVNMEIKADSIIGFTFELRGRFLGRSSEQFVWVFNGFKIGRIFDIEVYDTAIIPTSPNVGTQIPRKDVTATQLIDRSSGVIMPGRRSFSPAAFVPVKLGQFSLSDKILMAALPDEKMNLDDLMLRVEKVLPCLKEDLRPETYLSRMHGLLFLEEVAMLKQVGELQLEKATFKKNGDCLILVVPALSPYTTKLVAGDMLIASLPYSSNIDERKFEGVIHKVTRTELWLQFAKDFHDSYVEGTYYSVSFVTSRASLRRMHQAINLAAKHLGFGWLFPTFINPRPPQVIVEQAEESITSVPIKNKSNSVKEIPEELFRQLIKKSGGMKGVNQINYLVEEASKLKSQPAQGQKKKDFHQLYSPDPRKISLKTTNTKLSIEQKLMQAGTPARGSFNRGRGLKYGRGGREINWNRHGSGYGMHCTIDNESKVKISVEQKKTIRWFNRGLNAQQKEAVINVLLGEARPLPYVIFGPPGTGKTVTVVETILQLHALIPESRLLVATPSNSAADLIAERLLESGDLEQGDLLRMVGYHYLEQGRISASIIPYSAVPDVKAINISGASGSSHEGVQMCGRELLGQHRVTVGTLGCLGLLYNMGFPRGHFTHVIVDEAGQATEPEVLIPMVFLHMQFGQVVLAGDPLQLGPVVTSRLASKCGLQDSLLARLLNRYPYTRDIEGFSRTSGYDPRLVTKLVNNYRSLPRILKLPSMLFYDNDLIPNVSEVDSEEAKILRAIGGALPCGFNGHAPPLLFHGVRGNNQQEIESHSWYNPEEVMQTFMYLNILYKAGLLPEQIGVITPYQLQSNKIRFMLEKMGVEAPKVGSVEEFQGQEKLAIIVSVVRSSPELISVDMQKALGFVANARRLNVALSRARALLIILGNPHLLSLDMHWSSVLRHCVKQNVYIGCDLPADFKV